MTPSSPAADTIAARLTAAHSDLALKWLERLASLLPVAPTWNVLGTSSDTA